MQPTVVLVHGAFAESSSWDDVVEPLVVDGYGVVAAANPLRGLASDAAAVSDLVRTIEGPVVLVAHSYGVPVIKAAVMGATQRPATQEALTEPSGERPLWQEVPSWFVIGEEDRIIPPELQHFMAKRAGAQRTVTVEGASHAISVSNPTATLHAIFDA